MKQFIIAVISIMHIIPFFAIATLAVPDDIPPEDTAVIISEWSGLEQVPPLISNEPPPPTPQPFTPPGTGTVVDNVTERDGKEFYTIMTPDEHIFYLVIDKQRGTENVYFLNAVTVIDLLSLAEMPEIPWEDLPWDEIIMPPLENPDSEQPEKTPAPSADEPDGDGGGMSMYMIIGVIAVIGIGAGWYFKVYRPKQQGAGNEDEYEPPSDEDEPAYPDWDESDFNPIEPDGEEEPPEDNDE